MTTVTMAIQTPEIIRWNRSTTKWVFSEWAEAGDWTIIMGMAFCRPSLLFALLEGALFGSTNGSASAGSAAGKKREGNGIKRESGPPTKKVPSTG